jgi:hypothetical protein
MTVLIYKFCLCHKTLDPDSATCLAPEPDSMNPDTKHC